MSRVFITSKFSLEYLDRRVRSAQLTVTRYRRDSFKRFSEKHLEKDHSIKGFYFQDLDLKVRQEVFETLGFPIKGEWRYPIRLNSSYCPFGADMLLYVEPLRRNGRVELGYVWITVSPPMAKLPEFEIQLTEEEQKAEEHRVFLRKQAERKQRAVKKARELVAAD